MPLLAERLPLDVRILGPLEILVDGALLKLTGGKPRALLGLLLLRARRPVPVSTLIDELWPDGPPDGARHNVVVLVSRLRRDLAGAPAIALTRRGTGYVVDLPPDALDRERFEALAAPAVRPPASAALPDPLRAALALWRGPVLEGIPLVGDAASEADALTELAARVRGDRIEADLAHGRHLALIGELGSLVSQRPFDERLLGQLMVALARSGRQTEALAAFQAFRERLATDLGLDPSPETRSLHTAILRQEVHAIGGPPTATATEVAPAAEPVRVARGRRRRRVHLVSAVAVGTALTVGAGLVVRSTDREREGDRQAAAATADRGGSTIVGRGMAARLAVGLVGGLTDDALNTQAARGARQAARDFGVPVEIVDLGLTADDWSASLDRLAGTGRYDAIIGVGSLHGGELVAAARRHPSQRFVLVDGSAGAEPGAGPANLGGVVFADEQSGFLAGLLAGLMARTPGAGRGATVLSAVAAEPVPSIERYLAGWEAGARRARPTVRLLRSWTGSFARRDLCATAANGQVDRGSQVIFAPAGPCGHGALSAAGLRGARAIGVDDDLSYLGSHVLASATKRFDRAVYLSAQRVLERRLAYGGDLLLDLAAEGVALEGLSDEVPDAVRRRLAAAAVDIRSGRLRVPSRLES